MTRPSWDAYFMLHAALASTRSTCLSRPTGAVFVRDKQILATGYNGSMPGAPHCTDDGECYRRAINGPEGDKYNWCRSTHAEANGVAQAAKEGISLEGSTCFCTLAPCYVCLKLMASAGVKHIRYELDYESQEKDRDKHWKAMIKESPILSIERVKIVPAERYMAITAVGAPVSERRI